MVSYSRAPRSDSSGSSSPSSPKCVNFGDVSVSRQVTNEEHWSLYSFEVHAAECEPCADPYLRFKAGKKLCKEGNRLAREICRTIYGKEGQAYCRFKEEGKNVRVELPSGYNRSRALLKAVEKAVKHKIPFITAQKQPQRPEPEPRAPAVSARGNFHSARPAFGAPPIRQPARESPPEPFDWRQGVPAPMPEGRWYKEPPFNAAARRGSLYGEDMARLLERELREGQLAYKIELREPVSRHRSGHRHHRPHSGLFF